MATTEGEVELLRRRLDRERRARVAAERLGESATAELWQIVQQLEEADRQLRAKAELTELSYTLARRLRLDLDPQMIMRRAVVALGCALEVDRCLVRLADDSGIGMVMDQWVGPGVALLPGDTKLTGVLATLANSHAVREEGLWVDDVTEDPRFSGTASQEVLERLGAHAYAGVPILVGPHLVGWLALHMTKTPYVWTARDRQVSEGLAHDLGGALLQALAHQHQLETVSRLREVDGVKSEFVSRVSHELRTPLTSISGYVEMFTEESLGPLTQGQARALDVMSRNCDRLLSLTENLLVLSQIDAGELRLEHDPLKLAEIVGDVRLALVPVLAARKVEVEFGDVPASPGLRGDVHEIERVLMNLLTNAVKFTPDGGRVSLRVVMDDDKVRILVEDTGIGVAEEDLPHLFRRFFRARSATEGEIQGTGLGLSLVRSIVEAHGGTVTAQSRLGVGSSFTVTLPVVGVGAAQNGVGQASPALPHGDGSVGEARRPQDHTLGD